MKPNDPLTDPAAAEKLKEHEWVALHLPRFARARPAYVAYEKFLVECLREACAKIAPLAKIEARAKGLASFAEKILRKRNLYQNPSDPQPPDPLIRLTDLCGGRVITETSTQVEAVCDFIKRAFDIDWANSEDVRQRLQPTEFGYRSVHYIVIPSEKKLRAAGISTPIPDEIRGLKAELQVRTLLEHAWSDLGHDLLYKSDLSVPAILKRQFAAVAAVLESADREFERLLAGFAEYKASIGAHHSRSKLKQELARLTIVLQHDPKNLSIALRLGRIALAIGEHGQGISALDRPAFQDAPEAQEMLGVLLTELHWDSPRGGEFRRGCQLLEAAIKANPKDAEALRAFAECRSHCDKRSLARDLFYQAMVADPTDPVTVLRYIEFEAENGYAVLKLVAPMLLTAMARAERQIEARVNLPGAWSALAVFHLIMGKPFAALSALSQLIALCRISRAEAGGTPPRCAAFRALERMEGTVERLRALAPHIEGFAWFERLALIAQASVLGDPEALRELQRLRASNPPIDDPAGPVVILSGGCAPDVKDLVDKLRPVLIKAVDGASFTLISGGTRAGMAGIAGDVAEASNGRIKAVGYLPKNVPQYTKQESGPPRCAVSNSSEGNDFTPLEPLQAWTDLVAAGMAPSRVKLLCFAPGDISRAEMAIAMGLGARVGLIDNPSMPEKRRFDDPHWTGAPGFLPLPLDVSTLRVFLAMETGPLSKDDRDRLEPAAKMAHADYVRSATPKDPSLQPWDKLDESLRESNFQQVAFWQTVLATHGLKVRKQADAEKSNPDLLPPLLNMKDIFDEPTILHLAQLEHGRWNVERLAYGWRYAREKDVAKRLSPYLVPWDQVPEGIQQYDIEAIVDLPKKLREAGMEIEKVELKVPIKP